MEIYNLEKNNSEKISVGVDIGGTAVKIGLFYENGKIWAVLMSGRDYTGILVKEGMEENTD